MTPPPIALRLRFLPLLFVIIGIIFFILSLLVYLIFHRPLNHLPALSEIGIAAPQRFFFQVMTISSSIGIFGLGIIGLIGGFSISSTRFENVESLKVRIWRFIHILRCIAWIISGISLALLGQIPLHDTGSSEPFGYTIWVKYSISTYVHLFFTLIFFVSCLVAMTTGTCLTFWETTSSRNSSSASLPHVSRITRHVIRIWKLLSTLCTIIFWPIIPLLLGLLSVVACPIGNSTEAFFESCWVVIIQGIFLGALLQYATVFCIMIHLMSHIFDLRYSALVLNPDHNLDLFRDLNAVPFPDEDEFRVDSELSLDDVDELEPREISSDHVENDDML